MLRKTKPIPKGLAKLVGTWLAIGCVWTTGLHAYAHPKAEPRPLVDPIVALGFNDLGMHCMNQNFENLCILPPFNNLHAQVILRGLEPEILDEGVVVTYGIPGNTRSSNKTNFWRYAPQLFGLNLPDDIGLTGNGMTGTMLRTPNGDWAATGIPITPLMDDFRLNPYPLSAITATYGGMTTSTVAVVPVSWEISCNLCHGAQATPFTAGIAGYQNAVELDILRKHDARHPGNLVSTRPVLCAKCHADPALGTNGIPGVPTMSSAVHASHADRVNRLSLPNKCYACHPGVKTQCQRDVHIVRNVVCTTCHGGMAEVGDPARVPWKTLPTCGTCHRVTGHEYEEAGKLYKESRGHGGVMCAACHNSPHAILPTTNPEDNEQSRRLQGVIGTIRVCTVCHTSQPDDPFWHTRYH